MSTSLAHETPGAAMRRFFARLWADEDSRSMTIGLIGVVIVHLLLIFLAPFLLHTEHAAGGVAPRRQARQFNIEIAPNTFAAKVKPPPPAPFKFVETNPDAPENTPDKTNNFAARNQQVAQEKPTPNGKNDMPALEGKKDFQSSQIVSGQLSKIEDRLPEPAPMEQPQEAVAATPKAEQNPLSGVEKTEGESKTGYGTNIAKRTDDAKPVPERVEGVRNAPPEQDAREAKLQVPHAPPRDRPVLSNTKQVRPAIFAENKVGTENIGPVAVDARWSNYGVYLQRMIEAVQQQWEDTLRASRVYPPSGTEAIVKFRINSEGLISVIVSVEGDSSEQGKQASTSAITGRAPYGKWTDDMIAMLGDSQEMSFRFFYQ